MLVELDKSVNGNVSFGDDSKVPLKGKGSIFIRLKMENINLFQIFTTFQT